MIVIYVSVKTKEQLAEEFARRVEEIQSEVRNMPGCLKNEWYQHPESSDHFVMYGEFDTQENFESYLASSLVKRIGNELVPLLDAAPEYKHYQASIFEANH